MARTLPPTRVELPIVATSGSRSAGACTTSWNVTTGSDANNHGHTLNGTPEARTTTVMMSMRNQAPTRGCPELEHRATCPARVARSGLRTPGSARVETTEDSRAARLPLMGEGETASIPVARVRVAQAGICGNEAADDTFP